MIEQVSRLRSPEIQSTPFLSAVPEDRRDRWSAAATRADPARSAQIARVLACLKRFVGHLGPEARIVAGSDTPNPCVVPGLSLHRELELLVDSGLSPMQALLAATKTAAEFLGQAAALGTVEPGKIADFVVLRRDPLASITAARDVVPVVRDGRVVWSE